MKTPLRVCRTINITCLTLDINWTTTTNIRVFIIKIWEKFHIRSTHTKTSISWLPTCPSLINCLPFCLSLYPLLPSVPAYLKGLQGQLTCFTAVLVLPAREQHYKHWLTHIQIHMSKGNCCPYRISFTVHTSLGCVAPN